MDQAERCSESIHDIVILHIGCHNLHHSAAEFQKVYLEDSFSLAATLTVVLAIIQITGSYQCAHRNALLFLY